MREERLSYAHVRGLREANAGHAPRRMICQGRGIVETMNGALVGALAQALLVLKGGFKFI